MGALRIEASELLGYVLPRCPSDAGAIYGSTWSLTMDGRLDFARCDSITPYSYLGQLRTGSVVVDGGQLARFDAAMGALTRNNDMTCRADSDVLVLEVETPAGTFRYKTAEFACNDLEPTRTTYVDGITDIFSLLREWSAP